MAGYNRVWGYSTEEDAPEEVVNTTSATEVKKEKNEGKAENKKFSPVSVAKFEEFKAKKDAGESTHKDEGLALPKSDVAQGNKVTTERVPKQKEEKSKLPFTQDQMRGLGDALRYKNVDENAKDSQVYAEREEAIQRQVDAEDAPSYTSFFEQGKLIFAQMSADKMAPELTEYINAQKPYELADEFDPDWKERAFADAMMTNASDEDIDNGMRNVLDRYSANALLHDGSKVEIMRSLERKDKDGQTYYDFGGKRLYGDVTMGKIVEQYIKQHNHPIKMRDDANYREEYAKSQGFENYEKYVKAIHAAKVQPKIDALEAAYESYYASNRDTFRSQEIYGNFVGDVPIILPHWSKAFSIGEIKAKSEAILKPTFWQGLVAGAPEGLRTAAFDVSGLCDAFEMKNALEKAIKGENLSTKDDLMVKMYEAQCAIDEANQELRSGFSAARIGEGTAVGIGYAVNMAMTGAGGSMFSAGGKGAMQVFKQYARQSIKEALKKATKEAAKEMVYGLADDAVRSAVSLHTARNYANLRLGQYQFNDGVLSKEETNPVYDMYRAYMTQFVERGSERFGDFINDGVAIFGRGLAQSRFMTGLTGGMNTRWVNRMDDFAMPSAVSQAFRYARIQGIAGEYLSERANSYLTPIMTGEYFLSAREDGWMPAFNQHYASLLTSQSAWETFAVCGALSSSSYVLGAVGGISSGVQISKLRKANNQLLESITNPELRNKLSIAYSTGDYSGLAKLSFKDVSADDATRAMKYVYNGTMIQSMKDADAETERLETFAPVVMSIVGDAYRGVDIANPAPTTDVVTASAVIDGKEVTLGSVIFGDYENPQGTVQIKEDNGVIRNIPVEGVRFVRTSMSDALAEQYALMFSSSIAKERLDEVIENMRGVSNMSDEAYEAQLKANGFSVHKAGDSVTLVDGRTATVQGNASNGRYVVETTNEDGAKETSLVGFESILHETNDDMAEAQLASQAEGTIEAPVPLPTDKDGNIAFDEIDNGETLASVLPSQVGGVQNAVEMIDAEVQRLNEQQASAEAIGKHNGISEAIKAQKIAEANAKRIAVLQDARQRLATETTNPTTNESEVEPTAEQKEAERRDREDRMDSMSTYDFSREYRSRMTDSAQSRIILSQFVSNINSALAEMDNAEAEIDKQMSAVEAEISNAYSKATSEADMERIAEQTKDLQQKLDTLKADKIDIDITRRNHQHRKAQYEQTLKDMGVNVKSTIGEDVKLREFVKKASEVLGMPIEINGYAFTSSQQNGVHRIDKDGKSRIYINPNSTSVEQGVGILAHEIGHEFKKVLTPEEWAKFENLVMTARFGKDWANSEAYKKEIESIQDAERRSGHAQGVSDEKAREEAVTYALQTFIFDGKRGARAFEAILKQGDISWQDKIMNALREVFDKVKAIFGKEEGVAVREAIEEFGNIFKRYAERAGEIKAEQIEGETAAIINEKDGQSSFSLSTYEDGGRDILQNFLTSQVEGGKLDQKDANAILTEMDAIYDICMDYKDEYAPFGAWSEAAVVRDGEGMPVFSVIKKNDEYKMNLDFSLVCKKRRTLDAVLNEMIGRKLIEIAPDDPTFIAKVNDVVRKYGFETACRLCFVDAKRFRVVNTARNFCKLYNGVVAKLMPTDKKVAINSFDAAGVGYPTHESSLDTLADSELNIKALEDILKRNGEKTVIAKVARHLLEHPEDRKLVHISDFVSTRGFDPTKALNPQILSLYNSKKGSGGPKASFSDVQYLNDVAYANWNVDEAYAVGGVRVQSFSDYVPRMVFDYMQMVAELAAKQMPVHAYTKEAAFAKTFGLTGMKINMSLVPTVVEGGIAAGLDADGNYVWEEGETFDYDTAIEIQNADGYRENCGTIAVGVSDAHIEKMLDDDNIRMVIPYHKSGLNPAVAKHNNIAAFKDYTNQQSTRYANGTKLTKADEKHTPNFYENTRILGDPRKAADAYLAWCKENNYKPKFDKWASHPNYYKLLEDFTTLVDGEYFEQRGVTMTFPKEGDAFGSLSNLIAESLEEDAVLEGKRDSLVGAMVDEIESTLFSNREKALETSNSLQKQPNTQEVVTEADVVESFSIDRSQYLDEPEIDRAYALRSMDMIDSKVGINKPLAIANIINIVEKLAADDERKMMRGKMSAIDAKYAQEFINTYRAVANYGRAVLAEKFPEYIENSHEDNIKSGKTDLGKIRELFQKYNTDGEMAELFNLVSSVAEKFGTTFWFAALDNTTHGNYAGNAVRYKVGTLNSDIISDQDKANIILHEMIHAATSSAITLCENAQWRGLLKMSPSVKLRTSVRRLKTLLEDIRSNEEFKGEYGITDVHEMLAELSNPRFVEKLKKHDIWTRIVDGIREIASAIINMVTGKDVAKSDAYTEVRTTLTEIIEETPMEFIEGLNRLRDAGRIKGVKPLVAESAEEIAEPRTEQESYSILRDENTDTIFATAKEEFASTNDWQKTGWLMPDGTQLDFAEGGDYRGTDHRAIGAAYKGVAEHQWQYLQDFENRGGIRIHMNRDGKYGTIEMAIKPTAEQKKRLRSFIGAVGGNVDVDFMDENYNTAHSASYEGVSPARVLSGITSFYDEGIKPKGNVSYSVARLPKEEYAKLSSEIMMHQNVYNKPPFDYAFTDDKFYVYDYFGDGDFSVIFAADIEKDSDIIDIIIKGFRNGSINSARSIDSLLEGIKSGREGYSRHIADAVEKRGWDKNLYIPIPPRQSVDNARTPDVGNSDSTTTSSRGEDRRGVSLENSTKDSYSLNRTDIDYLDAVNRGDTLADKVRAILHEYDEGEDYANLGTIRDVADAIETIVDDHDGDENITTLKNILADFRMAQEDSRNWGDRMEAGGEDAFEEALRMFASRGTRESYSLNRDVVTIATPELEAEANPSDATRDKIDALRNEIKERIDRIATTKNVTFEEIEKMMLDESDESEDIRKWVNEYNRASRKKDAQEKEAGQKAAEDALQQKFGLSIKEAKRKVSEAGTFMTAIQKSAKNRYNRIIKAVLASLKASPSRGVMGEDVAIWVRRAMTQVYLDVADSNLKATQRDVKSILTKKYEKKNSKGEKEGWLVDYVAANIVERVQSFVKQFYQRINEKGDTVTDLGNPTLLWKGVSRPDVKAEIDRLAAELDDLQGEYDKAENANGSEDELNKIKEKMQICEGVLELLDEFRIMCSIAEDIADTENNIKQVRNERNELRNTEWRNIYKAKTLVQSYNDGKIDAQKALTELQKLGYGDVAEAQQAIDGYEQRLENKKSEIFALQRQLASEKLVLLDATKDFNTAVYGIEAVGRIALKEETAKRKEEKRLFRNGVLRSIRNPLFRNTMDYDEKEKRVKDSSGREYGWWKKYLLKRGGDAIFSEAVDTFEYRARRMDVMSIPNAWLHDGFYYQFMLHPTNGFLARSDWRFHKEREIRAKLDDAVSAFTGYQSINKMKGILNEKSPFNLDIARTDSEGNILSDITKHTLTVNECLYIRSAVRQDGVIRGYLAIGVTEEQIDNIIDWLHSEHPQLCALCDWIQSEGGIMEEMYAMRNVEYRRVNRIDLPHTEWYFPLKRVADAVPSQDSVGDVIPTSALANGIGSNKARTRNSIPMDLNAGFFSVLDSHIAESVQWTAYVDLFDKMNTLLSSPMFKKMVKVQGVNVSELKDAFLRAAGERLGRSESDGVSKTIGSLTKNAVAANVVGNLNTALKQLASITAGVSRDFNPMLWGIFVKNFPIVTNLSTAVEKGWRKYKGDDIYKEMDVVRSNYYWAIKNIPTFAERVHNENMGMDIFKQDGFQRWDQVSGWIKKIGMAPNRFMDIIVSAAVAKTVYEFEYTKKRKRGLSHEEAHNDARMEAALVVNQTQQSDQGAFLSELQADKRGAVGKILSTTFTAYNNSQFAFDRNARASLLNLMSLSFDGGNKKRIQYLTGEYESRGVNHRKARSLAIKDLREAFITQFNTYVHNAVVNPVIWSVMPSVAMLGTALVQYLVRGDDDEEERRGYWEIVLDDLKKIARWSNLVYTLPGGTMPMIKMAIDAVAENGLDYEGYLKTMRRDRSLVMLQPLIDLIVESAKYFNEKDKEEKIFGDDVDSKVPALAVWVTAADTATRYGLGVSSSTMTRFVTGMWQAAVNGEIEDFMNATTQSKVLTKLMASRIRKGETMEDYIARVGGAYEIINSFKKGADDRELREQYIDKMDAIIVRENGNPFDYEAYKENLKAVDDRSKYLLSTSTYNGSEYSTARDKEGKEHLFGTLRTDDIAVHSELVKKKAYINYELKELEKNLNWDEQNAQYRLIDMQSLNDAMNEFLELWESNPQLTNKLNTEE